MSYLHYQSNYYNKISLILITCIALLWASHPRSVRHILGILCIIQSMMPVEKAFVLSKIVLKCFFVLDFKGSVLPTLWKCNPPRSEGIPLACYHIVSRYLYSILPSFQGNRMTLTEKKTAKIWVLIVGLKLNTLRKAVFQTNKALKF